MVATNLPGVLITSVAASRPAANAVAGGTVHFSSDTGRISQSDGVSTWTTFFTSTVGGFSNPLTTTGDIIYSSSGSTAARLAAPAAGKFLTGAGTSTAPAWGQGPLTTTGDLLLGATGGTPTRLAAGSTSGHVLTSTGTGSNPSWQAAAGGGGGKSYVTQPGLRPPDSPGTGDVEFLDYANATDPTTTPALTWGNQGTATGVINSGRLVMASPTSGNLRALLKAVPGSGNFSCDVAVSAMQWVDVNWAGIVMLWGTPGTPTTIKTAGRYYVSSGTRLVWTSYNTSWAATGDDATVPVPLWGPLYLRIEWDGTNLLYKVSNSGISDTFGTFTTQTLGLGRPDYIGVGVDPNGATPSLAAFHFMRFGWTADFDPTTDD